MARCWPASWRARVSGSGPCRIVEATSVSTTTRLTRGRRGGRRRGRRGTPRTPRRTRTGRGCGQVVDRLDRLDALPAGEFLGGHEVVRRPVLGMLGCAGHVVTSGRSIVPPPWRPVLCLAVQQRPAWSAAARAVLRLPSTNHDAVEAHAAGLAHEDLDRRVGRRGVRLRRGLPCRFCRCRQLGLVRDESLRRSSTDSGRAACSPYRASPRSAHHIARCQSLTFCWRIAICR